MLPWIHPHTLLSSSVTGRRLPGAASLLVAILSTTEVSAEGSDGPEGLRERGQQLPVDFSKAQTEPLLITTNTGPAMNYAFLV